MSGRTKTKTRKIKPRVPKNGVAKRVCDWINTEHGGNISQAAAALGLSYDPLHRQAYGIVARPNLTVIQALALKTGRSVDYWLTGS